MWQSLGRHQFHHLGTRRFTGNVNGHRAGRRAGPSPATTTANDNGHRTAIGLPMVFGGAGQGDEPPRSCSSSTSTSIAATRPSLTPLPLGSFFVSVRQHTVNDWLNDWLAK